MIKENLEALNGIRTEVDIGQYVAKRPIESEVDAGLMVVGDDQEISMKIFFRENVLDWVNTTCPGAAITYQNRPFWAIATEEVSHLVYLSYKLQSGISPFDISRFELELQANIDTYLFLSLRVAKENGHYPRWMKSVLFEGDAGEGLHQDISSIYVETSRLACIYAQKLEERLIGREKRLFVPEIRKFYQLDGNAKARHILDF